MTTLHKISGNFEQICDYSGHSPKPRPAAFKNQSQGRRLWKAVQKAWLGLAFGGWLWLALASRPKPAYH